MSTPLDIGEVVRRTGVPVSTLHVWERHGLIAPVGRAGLRRQYDTGVLDRIAMIIVGQRAGFSLAELDALLDRATFEQKGKPTLRAKIAELRARQAELELAITSLEHAVACPHAVPIDCPTFTAMLDGVLPTRR